MQFSKDFLWGAASAAYQVEGAYDEDGKGPGIWDALSHGHVANDDTGNVACDHYHRYKEDVALMKQLGLKAYRFSVSWPRVMPKQGVINPKGLQFYSDLVDELCRAGIEPMCTLFHWNLPMWAHEQGGWRWDGISDVFAEYTKVVVEALSDRVTYWMTINEPSCFIGGGYFSGDLAPFECGRKNLSQQEVFDDAVILSRNVLLAHGKAVKAIRETTKRPAKIGMAQTGKLVMPISESEADIADAKRATFEEFDPSSFMHDCSWWSEPVFLRKAPYVMEGHLSEEDLDIISQPLDFVGHNCYNLSRYDEYKGTAAPKVGRPRTAMDWPITPDALYWTVRLLNERYHLPVVITENGMANLDFVMRDGKVHDPQRIDYLEGYLAGVERAVAEGYPMLGYLYWSIMDNFEWAKGYDRRFGLIHVDYQTQKRTLKDSAYWYADYIKKHS